MKRQESTRVPLLKQAVGAVVDFFVPACCPLCHTLLTDSSPLCGSCRGAITPLPEDHCPICVEPYVRTQGLTSRCQGCLVDPPAFRRLFAAGLHEGPLKKAVHRLKYGGKVSLDRPLAQLLREAVPVDLRADLEALVPVPLEPTRFRQRMYNQAELLCRGLARLWDLPLLNCLERSPGGRPQQGLSGRERRDNLKGQITLTALVEDKTLLLVDDVCTTGSTLRACSQALIDGGAKSVYGLVLARTDRRAFPLTPQEVY